MCGTPRLVRRGGVFYFHMAVPKDLIPVVGRGEVKTTLNTTDRGYATLVPPENRTVTEATILSLLVPKDD